MMNHRSYPEEHITAFNRSEIDCASVKLNRHIHLLLFTRGFISASYVSGMKVNRRGKGTSAPSII